MFNKNDVACDCGNSELIIDFDESKKWTNEIGLASIVYCCQNCGKLYVLQHIGDKPRGWKTKKLLDNKKKMDSIPF